MCSNCARHRYFSFPRDRVALQSTFGSNEEMAWARCIVSSAVDVAEAKLESWIVPAQDTHEFLEATARRHIEMERALVFDGGRKFRRE